MKDKSFLKVTVTVLCLLLLLAGCSRSEAATLAKKLELGQKYLEELSFEQAVAVFEEAIAIDPKAWDAYVGLASAYKGLGDLGQAAAALERGMEEAATESFDIPQEDMDFLAEIYEQYATELTEQGDAEAAEEVQQKLQELQAGETGNAGESEGTSTQQKPSEETSAKKSPRVETVKNEDGLYVVYEYDENEHLTKETYYTVEGSIERSCVHELDEAGKKVKDHWYRADGTAAYTMEYDGEGREVKCTSYWSNRSEREVERWYTIEYGDGGEFKETWYWGKDRPKAILEYDSEGKLVRSEGYNSFDKPLCYTYEYDDSGHLTKESGYRRSDGSIYVWCDYEYNSNGQKAKVFYYDAQLLEEFYCFKNVYEYDSKGQEIKCTQSTLRYPEGDVTRCWTISEYNDAGQKIKETCYNAKGEAGSWLSGEYDRTGQMVRLILHTSDGNSYSHDYEYDSRGKLIGGSTWGFAAELIFRTEGIDEAWPQSLWD